MDSLTVKLAISMLSTSALSLFSFTLVEVSESQYNSNISINSREPISLEASLNGYSNNQRFSSLSVSIARCVSLNLGIIRCKIKQKEDLEWNRSCNFFREEFEPVSQYHSHLVLNWLCYEFYLDRIKCRMCRLGSDSGYSMRAAL